MAAALAGGVAVPVPAHARPSHCAQYDGAMIMVDKKFLGKLANRYDSLSIFNRYGNFGSKYSSESIWNRIGTYGSPDAIFSPFNATTVAPPAIMKNNKIIGFLTINRRVPGGVNPYSLGAMCYEFTADD
jgi:hypothetical protein